MEANISSTPAVTTSNLHVIFGTGPLGKWTARELIKRGHRVRLINRSGRASALPETAEVVKGDAYDPAQTTEFTRGASAIYQCAQPAYHPWADNFPRMQAAILAAAVANGAKLIAAENLYVYGDTHGQPMREDMPYNAHTKKGRIRQAMTEALFAAHQSGQVRAASVRGSDFFGPDDSIYAENIFVPALHGKPVNALGNLDQAHSFTYTADFGAALAIAGTNDAALGRAWHVPSAPPITQRALVKLIEQEIGKPVRTSLGTPFIVRALGLFNPTLREIVEMMYEFTQPFVMDSSAFTATFGLRATPQHEQIRNTLAWVKTHPLEKR